MQKNNPLKVAANLVILSLAVTGLLSVFRCWEQQCFLRQPLSRQVADYKEVFPAASAFEPVREDGRLIYEKALGRRKNILGYVFVASGRGYSGDIIILVGMDKEGVVTRIKILSQNETPGLGSRIMEVARKETFLDMLFQKSRLGRPPRPWFQELFSGKRVDELGKSVQAITGATITSHAVIDSIQEKARELLMRIDDER